MRARAKLWFDLCFVVLKKVVSGNARETLECFQYQCGLKNPSTMPEIIKPLRFANLKRLLLSRESSYGLVYEVDLKEAYNFTDFWPSQMEIQVPHNGFVKFDSKNRKDLAWKDHFVCFIQSFYLSRAIFALIVPDCKKLAIVCGS